MQKKEKQTYIQEHGVNNTDEEYEVNNRKKWRFVNENGTQ